MFSGGLPKYVSDIDRKIEIKISDILQFTLVAHIYRPVTDLNSYYVNDRQSDLRRVKEGWYAMDKHGDLIFGPFSNRENCLTRISQSVNWSASFQSRRPAN
jgi:hypothetical protein